MRGRTFRRLLAVVVAVMCVLTNPAAYKVMAESGTTKDWVLNGMAESGFAGGDGTELNPYLVETAEQLSNVRNHLDACFRQEADIDLNVAPYNQSQGWVPIGDQAEDCFAGTYDGNGKTITGLYIKRTLGGCVGLFASLAGATIKDLTLADVQVRGDSQVGGLAGLVGPQGDRLARITDVHVIAGSVSGGVMTGGLAGELGGCEVVGSSAGCDVTGVDGFVGGFIGYMRSAATIEECSATGDVTTTGTGIDVGGFAGYVYGSTITGSSASGEVTGQDEVGGLLGRNEGTISGCFASGAVGGKNSVGGLVGTCSGGRVSGSYATGAVEGSWMSVGGLVGKNLKDSEIKNCYASGTATGVSQVGGLVGWCPSASIAGCYSIGEVTVTGNGRGGLLGEGGGIAKSYWDVETSGCDTSAGSGVVGKTTAEMKARETYVDWDFTEVWDIHPGQNDGYPSLRGVTEADPVVLSSEADISAFRFSPTDGVVIDYIAGSVELLVDSDIDVSDLAATFVLSPEATAAVEGVNQVSGVTAQDFTSPVTYTVTAEDDTTRNWTVTVAKREAKAPAEESLWHYRSPLPTAKSLRELKYLSGKLMAVGEVGALVASADGEIWTRSDLGIAEPLESIAYGNGKYVAIGNERMNLDGRIYGSADGVNWTHLATISDHYLGDTVCVNGKFVVVGQSERILTSTDGATWKITAAPEIKKSLSAVTYADGTFVAVGQSGFVATSIDGENWTEQSSVGGDTLRDVTYGNGRFVTVGGYDTGCIYSSTDRGETWSKYTFDQTCLGLLNSVDYDGSQFVTVGYRPTGSARPNLYTSVDGLTWQLPSSLPSDLNLAAVAGADGVWVA